MTKKFEIVYRDPADLIPYEMNAKSMMNSRSEIWPQPLKARI